MSAVRKLFRENQISLPFGKAFIEAQCSRTSPETTAHFPSFLEGLSLRVRFAEHALTSQRRFPFLFGGTFIEEANGTGAV